MSRVPFDPGTDYYQLLGVAPGASVEQIQAAYRRLAKTYHPDLHAGSAIAAARMARVNVAKSVLLDRDTRAIYDRSRASLRPPVSRIVQGAPAAARVRYAPQPTMVRPRHRVVSSSVARTAQRSAFDRQTGVLLLIALPLIAALIVYVFQAVQLAAQPLRTPSSDVNLAQGPVSRPTARGAADAVFAMVHAQPVSRELAVRANNLILSRSDSSPESELLRADGRRLLRSAGAGDKPAWDAAVDDVCHLAGRC
jgi:curved DNA-binding protein CbpA